MLFSENWSPRQKYVVMISMINMFLLQAVCMGTFNQSFAAYVESEDGFGWSASEFGNSVASIAWSTIPGIPFVIWLMGRIGVVWTVVLCQGWLGLFCCSALYLFRTP